jgi:hypothetical protein
MRFCFVLLAGLLLGGCSDKCAPSESCANLEFANALDGSWTLAGTAPYQSLRIQFTANGTRVSGTGTYGGLGRSGVVKALGDVETQPAFFPPSGAAEIPARASLVMDFSYDDGTSAHLDQSWLTGADTLRGVLSFISPQNAVSYGVVFVKAP